jgi:lactoylglutathione lyase
MSGRARQVFPMLSVADLETSLGLYRDLLGGELAYAFPDADDPAFVTLRFGDSELGLGRVADAPPHDRPRRPATGHRIELCVYVDDVDATAAAAAAAGIEVVTPPADQPWGERICFLADPDGNLLMLAAATEG